MASIIGEAFVILRPVATGFGASASKSIEKELGGTDVFASLTAASAAASGTVANDMETAASRASGSFDKATSHIASTFERTGTGLANWGIPFSGALGRVGSKIDDVDTKGQKLFQTMSTIGGTALGVAAIGTAAVVAESAHLAVGLQESDALIASHEDASQKAAVNIGKAFTSSAFTTIYSANEMASSLAPVSGELAQVNGKALTAGQGLQFMREAGDLAEATNSNLAGTTSTAASIMQGFQIPLKGVTGLTTDLYNTSRITGTGIESLGSVIDRLKARLGVATPTVADLSSLLVDLNEHGVQGARGLLVVNTAMTTLLNSVPKVDAAAAKAANSLSTKLATASNSTASATAALSKAQTDGAQSVANAQERLVEEQDRIAASTTANAPTTSQQIALQNAQEAVTRAQTTATQNVASAQDRLSTAQGKASTITTTAALSTNAQVKAMQQLGLQVYNTNGTFVGMRDVIAQLQPKLEGMNQEQQLAALTQVFGASASKALLETVLAGPAAYDKARKAVTDSTTAHKAAELQSQTLRRELDLLGAGLTDEGDKLGTWVIPKLQDFARWTETDITWLQKHKGATEAAAAVIGGALTLAVGAFAVNTGVKFTNTIINAGKSLGSLATTIGQKLGLIQTSEDDEATNAQQAAERTQQAYEQMSTAAQESAALTTEAMEGLVSSIDGLTVTMAAAVDKLGGAFVSLPTEAETATTDTAVALEKMVTDTEGSGLAIAAANEEAATSFAVIPAAAAAAAARLTATNAEMVAAQTTTSAEVAAANAKIPTQDLRTAPDSALEDDTAGGTKVPPEGDGVGASGVLTSLLAGAISYQATSSLLKNNTLGLGTAVTSLATGVSHLFGVKTTSTDADVRAKLGGASLAFLASKNPTAQDKEGTKLGEQLTVLKQLQATAYSAATQHGASSAQAKAAFASLYSTEQKWLPGLSKDTSTAAANRTMFLANANLNELKAKSFELVAQGGSLASSQQKLAGLKDTLKEQEKAGASESTLKDTKNSIAATQSHIDQLKSVSAKITKDSTSIQNAEKLKTSIDNVNAQMQQLRNQIKVTAPPKITSKGTITLKVKS